AFNMAEAICAAVARSPSCADPNMPAMRASLSMASATTAAGLGQLRFAWHFADEHGAHESATPRQGDYNNATRHASSLAGFALRQCGDPGADHVALGAGAPTRFVRELLILSGRQLHLHGDGLALRFWLGTCHSRLLTSWFIS